MGDGKNGEGDDPKLADADPADEGESQPKRLSPGDLIVIVIVGVSCLIGVALLLIRVVGKYPGVTAIFIAFFLAFAFAAATFRFLGGTRDATFNNGGLPSVLGTFKVGGSGALGLIFMLVVNHYADEQFKDGSIPQINELREDNAKLIKQLADKDQSQKNLEKESQTATAGSTPAAIVAKVRGESRTGELGAPLYAMSREHAGPWRSTRLAVSVITELDESTYTYCPAGNLVGQALKLVAIYDQKSGQSRQVEVSNGTNTGITCANRQPGETYFDIQISCQDGARLFPDDVTCSPKKVLWSQRKIDGQDVKGFRLLEVLVDDL